MRGLEDVPRDQQRFGVLRGGGVEATLMLRAWSPQELV